MNKIKVLLSLVIVCSISIGVMIGEFLCLPFPREGVSIGTLFAVGVNVVAILISRSKIIARD